MYPGDGYSWSKKLQKEIHSSMVANMKRAELKLKLEETYWTTHLMEFLKVTCVDGVKLSSRLKRILTLGVESTDHLNTPLGRTSGVYAALTDVINESTSPAVGYLFGVIFSMFNLEEHLEDNMLVPCHLSANIVGGLPILCYFIYSYRGHMDHLTENLRFVKYICRVEPTIYKLMTRILLVTESRGDGQLDQLVLDPQSLPIRSISDNFSFIKNSVHS